ncbi:hypothetical protein MYU51_001307 [Penicillium brevicompactum]
MHESNKNDCDLDLDLHAIWQESSGIPTPPPSRATDSNNSRQILSGVGRVRQFELLERRTWDRRSQGLLEPSRWVETARSQGCVLFLLPAAKGRAAMVSKSV